MNVIERIDQYISYVNENFREVEARVSLVSNPMLDSDENEFFKLIKIITISAKNKESEELRRYFFNKFMDKIKFALTNGNSVIFKNGVFSVRINNYPINVSSLHIDSDENEYKEFIKNVECGFFALTVYCYQFTSKGEEQLLKIDDCRTTQYIDFEKNYFFQCIWTYHNKYLNDEGQEKKLLKIMSYNEDINENICEQFFLDVKNGLKSEEIINNFSHLDITKQNKIQEVLEAIDLLNNNEYCTKEMKDIYVSFIVKKRKIKNDLMTINNFTLLFAISKEIYFFNMDKKIYGINQKFKNYREAVLEWINKLNVLQNNYRVDSNYFKDWRINLFIDDKIINDVFNFDPENYEESKLYMQATKFLIHLGIKESKNGSDSDINKLCKESVIKYYLNLLNYLEPLTIEEKISEIKNLNEALTYLSDWNHMFLKNNLEKYFYRLENIKHIDKIDEISVQKNLYTKIFTIEKSLLPELELDIKSKYVNTNTNKISLKINIMFTSILENISVSEMINEIRKLINHMSLNKVTVNDIDEFMESRLRNQELKTMLSEKKRPEESLLKKKI